MSHSHSYMGVTRAHPLQCGLEELVEVLTSNGVDLSCIRSMQIQRELSSGSTEVRLQIVFPPEVNTRELMDSIAEAIDRKENMIFVRLDVEMNQNGPLMVSCVINVMTEPSVPVPMIQARDGIQPYSFNSLYPNARHVSMPSLMFKKDPDLKKFGKCIYCGDDIEYRSAKEKARLVEQSSGLKAGVLCCGCYDKVKIAEEVIGSDKFTIIPKGIVEDIVKK